MVLLGLVTRIPQLQVIFIKNSKKLGGVILIGVYCGSDDLINRISTMSNNIITQQGKVIA